MPTFPFAPIKPAQPGKLKREVMNMKKNRKPVPTMDLRLDPQQRLCPAFDSVSIKLFAAPDAGEMGMRVLDNCAEEHIM